MSYLEFQEHWENAADAELESFKQQSVSKLLNKIQNHEFGDYYQIWYALQGRTTIQEAGNSLLSILHSNEEYLIRFHCATLLLSLYNPYPDVLSAVKLSGREKYNVDQRLAEYEEALTENINTHIDSPRKNSTSN